MTSYDTNVENLEKYISSEVREALGYSTTPEYLWEFCSSIADTADFGFKKNGKYLYLHSNPVGILSFCSKKKKRLTPLQLSDWVDDFTYRQGSRNEH
jgi:hypothetical protein